MIERAGIRTDRWIALAIAVGLFAIYAWGACRTIYVGDSGELVTAVHVLGIPHPSGYPLYVLLGKLWTVLVPVGSIAFRMSLFSAACAAAACALLYVTVRQDGGSRVAGLLGAGLLAFGPSFWHEANIQRVYALNALFVVLAINRAFAWHRDRRARDLALAMFVCGLGATNHTVMGLVGVAVAVWAPIVDRSLVRRPRIVALCGAAFFAGLSPYAYLPIRSRMNPVLNWGEPKTLEAFLDVVLRRDFWHRAWWEGPADLTAILSDFAKSLGPETGFAGIALAVILLVTRFERKWLLPILVVVVNVAAVARHGSFYDIFVWHRYYIPAYIMVIVVGAAGLDVLKPRIPAASMMLILAVPTAMLATGWNFQNRSDHRYADAFSRVILGSLPPGARLITRDDNVLFSLLYSRYVESYRPDVELIAEGVDQRIPPLFFDPEHDFVFFTHPPTWAIQGLDFVPRGPVIQAVRAGSLLPVPFERPPLAVLADRASPEDLLTRTLIAHDWFMRASTWEPRDWPRAEDALRRMVESAPDSPVVLCNAALIWERNGFLESAQRLLEAAAEIDPRGTPLGVDRASGNAMRFLPGKRAAEVADERARLDVLERQIQDGIPRGFAPGTPDWHDALADGLEARGERHAARFHRLLALSYRK